MLSTVALPKVTDTFSSLIFFYDPSIKRILFSNMPVENFFGAGIGADEDLPFSIVDDKKLAREINHEWQTCLQLKEKQTHHFWFNKRLPDDSLIAFRFTATGVRMENDGGNGNCILFNAEKSASGANASWIIETERLRKTLNRYRTEYAEFIDIAAHNLDAPLRKLSVLIERLPAKKNDNEEEMRIYNGRIKNCLDDMRSLIDSLATLSRVTSATMKPEMCSVDEIVNQEWRELKLLARGKNAELITSALPELEGDAGQYRHLFRQILENSIRFGKKNVPLKIQISSQNTTGKEKNSYGLQSDITYFKIECKDNGIGFRQEYAEKIFRPFVRLHGKSEFPGNGIGLALCRSIVDNHRGVIYAEGVEEEGSRFILLLPQTIN